MIVCICRFGIAKLIRSPLYYYCDNKQHNYIYINIGRKGCQQEERFCAARGRMAKGWIEYPTDGRTARN